MISKVKKIILDKNYRFLILSNKGFYQNMDDSKFLKKKFRILMNKNLNLENPKTFNEKLQWLKLFNRNTLYTKLVDKYEVKQYVSKILGDEYIIPTIGVWDSDKDIDFSKLPNQFVLKCTHNSGLGMFICKDKKKINYKKVRNGLKKGLNENYYLSGREWPYKNVKPRIIAEQYMEDKLGGLVDYKFFCFNGYVDCVMVCIDRHINDPKFYFFDDKWNLLRINQRGKDAAKDFTLEKPKNLEKMFEIASKLSKNIPFVRIDLYECNEKIYFGEYTFFPQSGFDENLLPETDLYFGNLITLENKEA